MIGRFLFCLLAAVCSAAGLCSDAVATTKNVTVVVTHNGQGSVIATHDFYEPSLSSAPPGNAVPYTFGQAFRMGDVPSGMHAAVTDANGNMLPYQIDEISPTWPDGSWRHVVFTTLVPATNSGTTQRLQLVLQSGTYAPTSTPRAISEISAHNYQIHYQNVLTHPGTAGWSGSPPTSTQPYSWTTKGSHSGNFTCNIDNFIAAGQYEIRANGPVRLEAHVYGFMTDDGGGTDPHLYCEDWIDVYSDPSNSAQVMYVEQMPLISQPIANPSDGSTVGSTSPNAPDANADFVIGQASLCDGNSSGPACAGATKLRDFADDAITLTPSNVIPGGGGGRATFSPPSGAPPQTRTGYRVHLISGSLPAGLGEGTIGFAWPPAVDYPNFSLRPDIWTIIENEYPITTTGSGSFQLIPLQHTAYYNGFFITQNSAGVPVQQAGSWTPPAGWFPQPDLDGTTNDNSNASQKAYWQQTGLIPGWDLSYNSTITPTTQFGWSVDEMPSYAPGSNGPYRTGIDGPGGDYDTDGPWNEWIARWWVRMGTSNWSPAEAMTAWNGAIYTATLPNTLMARAPIGTAPPRILPLDYGPDNSGGSYSGLGMPCPNDSWYASNVNADAADCYVFPAGMQVLPHWVYGPYSNSFSNYHWPTTAVIEYLMFGRDYILKLMRANGQRSLLQQAFARNKAIGGTTYYQSMLYCTANGEVIVNSWASALLGPTSDPEMAYLQHVKSTNEAYFQAAYNNNFTPTEKAAGACLSSGTEDGFNSNYADLGFAWSWAASRVHGPDYILKMRATLLAGMFDAASTPGLGTWGVSPAVGGYGWYDTIFGGWSWPITGNAPDPTKVMGIDGGFGPIGIATNGIVSYDSSWDAVGLNDGDELVPSSDGSNANYQGPPELGPPNFPEDTALYLINTNQTAHTFQLTSVKGDATHIISSISPGSWNTPCNYCWWNLRPKTDNGGFVSGAAGSLSLLRKAALAEFLRTGIPTDSTYAPSLSRAYSLVNTRFPNSTWPNCYQYQASSSFARICMTDAVPVYPPLSGGP